MLGTAHKKCLAGTHRLHNLFIKIESITPDEFKNGSEALAINYCFADSPFGKIIVASTTKGICSLFFEEDENQAFSLLTKCFPNAQYNQMVDKFQQDTLSIFQNDWRKLDQIKLHLKGTEFQLKVWKALLTIPMGQLTTYSSVAQHIDRPKASRAVGTAIGSNPIAFLIPCHRVTQKNGQLGGYMWGATRKSAIIDWEASRSEMD